MNTQTAVTPPPQLATPAGLFQQRLLTQTCSIIRPIPAPALAQAPYTLHAIVASTLPEDILDQTGYCHDGLNE